MKKTFSLICVLSALIFGAVFTGCDADDNDFIAPSNIWVYKENSKAENSISYSWNDTEGNTKKINFDLYVNYATEEKEIKFNNDGKANVKKGLNVILVPILKNDKEAQNNIKHLINEFQDVANIEDICLFYNFGTKEYASTDDSTKNEKQISLNTTAWTLIYNFNRFETYSDKQFDTLKKTLTLASASTNLNFKRILYNIIGEKLFADN